MYMIRDENKCEKREKKQEKKYFTLLNQKQQGQREAEIVIRDSSEQL